MGDREREGETQGERIQRERRVRERERIRFRRVEICISSPSITVLTAVQICPPSAGLLTVNNPG